MSKSEKQMEKENARNQKIIDTAFQIFVERKIEPVSMGEIADAVGIGRATLFRCYANKTELVIAVCAAKWKAYLDKLDEVRPLSSIENIPAIDRFIFTLDSYIWMYQNYKELLLYNDNFNHYVTHEGVDKEKLKEFHRSLYSVNTRLDWMYEKAKEDKTFRTDIPKEEFMREFLVFAAIATVGDIVDLVSENRTIVKNGLKHINDIDNKGLKALIEANELTGKVISSYHISFIIGPCINAGGRLDTARKAFELFRCTSENEAVIKAIELKDINDERKEMTAFYTEKALDILKNDDRYKNQNVIVVYLHDCHESLAGIIAGRIKEIYYKPVFVLTDCEEGVKGSGRSIEGYSMYEEMVKADTRFRQENTTDEHLFIKYGGHKMAAGLSIDKDRIDIFREYLNSSDGITEDMLVEKVWIDVALPFEYLSFDFIEQLDILEPFGRANERPVFAEKCRINRIRVFGKNRNVISLSVRNEAGTTIDATCFEEEVVFMDYLKNKFSETDVDNALNGRENNIRLSIIYYPEINEYRGFKNIRVVIKRYS